MTIVAICLVILERMRLSIWHRYGDMAPQKNGVKTLTFWGRRSCDHSTRGGRLPMGGP